MVIIAYIYTTHMAGLEHHTMLCMYTTAYLYPQLSISILPWQQVFPSLMCCIQWPLYTTQLTLLGLKLLHINLYYKWMVFDHPTSTDWNTKITNTSMKLWKFHIKKKKRDREEWCESKISCFVPPVEMQTTPPNWNPELETSTLWGVDAYVQAQV